MADDNGREEEEERWRDFHRSDHDLLIEVSAVIREIKRDIAAMKKAMVTQAEYWPIRTMVYSGAGLILTAFIVTVITLIIHSGSAHP